MEKDVMEYLESLIKGWEEDGFDDKNPWVVHAKDLLNKYQTEGEHNV